MVLWLGAVGEHSAGRTGHPAARHAQQVRTAGTGNVALSAEPLDVATRMGVADPLRLRVRSQPVLYISVYEPPLTRR